MGRQALLVLTWLLGALAWVFLPQSSSPAGDLLALSRGSRLDLGPVAAGKHEVRFDVTNVSGQIVHLDKVSGSCTCMDVALAGGRLMPGEVRPCVVTINVQPKSSQSTAVFIDVSAPRVERLAVMMVYRGVQQDQLRLTVEPELRQLDPDACTEIVLTAEWRSAVDLQPEDQVRWNLQDAAGVTLLSQTEERQDRHVRARATLALDARFRDSVTAVVEVEAGRPVRASERRRFRIPVTGSVKVTPEVLLVEHAPGADRLLGEIAIELAPGWTIRSVEAADWLAPQLADNRLLVRTRGNPPFQRGVSMVTLVAADAHGRSVGRRVQCVVDMEE